MTTTYRAYQVSGKGEFALVERELREPGPGEVRIRVEACGVCHSDLLAVAGLLRPDPAVPMVPGHEIAGVVDAVGAGVRAWKPGDRAGVGFLNGPCYECDHCRRGDFVDCADQQTTGTTVDGGYAEIVYARASGLVRLPAELSAVEAAPLLCAGITVYRGLTDLGLRPGSLVAVQGLGGLGHLAVQYASRLGHRVVAIARGTGKAALADSLGADDYVDSTAEDPAAALRRLGGADAILATGANGGAMSALVGGLAAHGRLVVIGAGGEPMTVDPAHLLFPVRAINGTMVGTAIQTEDALAFAVRHGVRSANEIMPLSEAPKAYERMMAGDARFRIVLDSRS
ncbi:alcohol dehydrogenase catalytic domain-containing protein [Paractinoplanes globisporus]|uniref:alcohol dehydrogenase n=1 Tax=Paractinoplanes globisporus TaxID=113565 RepID=A0ABW6W4D9_9ACTN|nr:alcohol dehydrogenase catalytic domain-containing protein [Actinoplanes globisporus]